MYLYYLVINQQKRKITQNANGTLYVYEVCVNENQKVFFLLRHSTLIRNSVKWTNKYKTMAAMEQYNKTLINVHSTHSKVQVE